MVSLLAEAVLFESALWIVQALDNLVEPALNPEQRLAIDPLDQSAPLGIHGGGTCPSNFVIVIQEAFETYLHSGGAPLHQVVRSIVNFKQLTHLVDLIAQPIEIAPELFQVVPQEADNVRDPL